MILSRNKKNNVYPLKPQFYYIKVGFKGVRIILACFRDAENHKVTLHKDKIWNVKTDPESMVNQVSMESKYYLVSMLCLPCLSARSKN